MPTAFEAATRLGRRPDWDGDRQSVTLRDVDTTPYDALLLVSFGGPEKPDDVVPFLSNVTAGRNIPVERLEEVGEHYYRFGGRSPINDQCRALLQALREDFGRNGVDLPIYWGNRNWHPYLGDTLARMNSDGVRRAICFITSAYASYSGCRQYRENLYAASHGTSVSLDRLRHGFNHPGFIAPFVEGTERALQEQPGSHVIFVTHSIPDSMNAASGGPGCGAYVRQHHEVAELITGQIGVQAADWSLAFCSRSGSPHTPWLEPDINDHLRSLRQTGTDSVIVVPIGFLSDHMEVIYDLDVEAAETAAELSMAFNRVPTPGTHADFVAMIRDLVVERAGAERGEAVHRRYLGTLRPHHDICPSDCCIGQRDLPTIS